MKNFIFLKKIFFVILILIVLILIAWRIDRTFFHPYIPDFSQQIQNDITTYKFSIPQDETSCQQAGGFWQKIGIRPALECNLPTTDSDKSCVSGKECEGICLANLSSEQIRKGMSGKLFKTTGTCSAWVKQVGCLALVYQGWAQVVCLD